MKRCRACKKLQLARDFQSRNGKHNYLDCRLCRNAKALAYYKANRAIRLKAMRRQRANDPVYFHAAYMFYRARRRAKYKCLPFQLCLQDVYELLIRQKCRCACCQRRFHMKFTGVRGAKLRSASLDRSSPRYGYTVQNIAILCYRCNLLKSDASLDELLLVVAYIKRLR